MAVQATPPEREKDAEQEAPPEDTRTVLSMFFARYYGVVVGG